MKIEITTTPDQDAGILLASQRDQKFNPDGSEFSQGDYAAYLINQRLEELASKVDADKLASIASKFDKLSPATQDQILAIAKAEVPDVIAVAAAEEVAVEKKP